MAKVKVRVIPEKKTITMSLSRGEAETLRAIFSRIGGDPHKSLRKYVEDMNNALCIAGILLPQEVEVDEGNLRRNTIYFGKEE